MVTCSSSRKLFEALAAWNSGCWHCRQTQQRSSNWNVTRSNRNTTKSFRCISKKMTVYIAYFAAQCIRTMHHLMCGFMISCSSQAKASMERSRWSSCICHLKTGKQNLHVFHIGRAADAAAAVVSAAATAKQQQQLLFNVAVITNHFGSVARALVASSIAVGP